MHYFSFKLLLGCAECGERFPFEGATLSATCPACHSATDLLPSQWKSVFELYRDATQFPLVEVVARAGADGATSVWYVA